MARITITELPPPPQPKRFNLEGLTAQDIQDLRNSLYASMGGAYPEFGRRCGELHSLIPCQHDPLGNVKGSYE